MDADEHDHEAGRQLSMVFLIMAWMTWPLPLLMWLEKGFHFHFLYLFPLATGFLALLSHSWPVVAVQLFSGRFDDAWERLAIKARLSERSKLRVKHWMTALQEGTPWRVVSVERRFPDPARRRRRGRRMMNFGLFLFVASLFVNPLESPGSTMFTAGASGFVLGLILWYRAL